MSKADCSIEECDRPALSRGWCSKHYARWRSKGDPLKVQWEVHQRPKDGLCTLDGCDRPYYYSGVCSGHYVRRVRHGDSADTGPLEDRFYSAEDAFNAHSNPGDGCSEWTGWISPGGYGKFKTGGKSTFAHRYAWERVNGPIPDGMVIDHACHNTACVNVDHLRLATPTENTRNLSGAKSDNKYSCVRNVGKMGDRWRVRITKDGISHALGCYATIEEAAAVAEAGRKRLFGEFAGKG